MLRNRSFLVKVVKDPETESKESPDYDALVRTITQGVVLVIVVYMGADSLRKILVHTAATKIN